MLCVKVVTPLVLKRWVWPMIKCSHLTPKSIYSYIDDLVIANFLIDVGVFVHALPYFSFAILLCEHVDCIFYSSRTSICCFVCWALSLLPNGWTRMPKNSLYLSMLFSSQTLFMLHHKVWSSQIRTLCVSSTRSPQFVIDLNFQNLSVFRSDRFIPFDLTEFTELIYVFNIGATD